MRAVAGDVVELGDVGKGLLQKQAFAVVPVVKGQFWHRYPS